MPKFIVKHGSIRTADGFKQVGDTVELNAKDAALFGDDVEPVGAPKPEEKKPEAPKPEGKKP